MVTLSSCLIWQIISFILPPNDYGCVCASLSGPTSAKYVRYIVKKVKATGILIDKPKPKTVRTPEYIAAVAGSMCEVPSTSIHSRSQQLNISKTSLRRILRKEFGFALYKLQLVQGLKPIDHPMCFRFAKWACDRLTEDADFGKKIHLLRWRLFWSWQLCKQAKLSHLGHSKIARIHWKADASKTSHCLVQILVQRHNWATFLRKWARRGRYSQWRSLSSHVVWIFVHKN